jgi:hypothetical protein
MSFLTGVNCLYFPVKGSPSLSQDSRLNIFNSSVGSVDVANVDVDVNELVGGSVVVGGSIVVAGSVVGSSVVGRFVELSVVGGLTVVLVDGSGSPSLNTTRRPTEVPTQATIKIPIDTNTFGRFKSFLNFLHFVSGGVMNFSDDWLKFLKISLTASFTG